ncbi:MAG: hypothetical protein MHMPM18_004024, partial [Marteilia pararefringens]
PDHNARLLFAIFRHQLLRLYLSTLLIAKSLISANIGCKSSRRRPKSLMLESRPSSSSSSPSPSEVNQVKVASDRSEALAMARSKKRILFDLKEGKNL